MIGFIVFNSSKQIVKHMRGQKQNKQSLLTRLRKPIMRQGFSVFVQDETTPLVPVIHS